MTQIQPTCDFNCDPCGPLLGRPGAPGEIVAQQIGQSSVSKIVARGQGRLSLKSAAGAEIVARYFRFPPGSQIVAQALRPRGRPQTRPARIAVKIAVRLGLGHWAVSALTLSQANVQNPKKALCPFCDWGAPFGFRRVWQAP